MRAKKVTAKKVLAYVILSPFLIPTAVMCLVCYPIIWAACQLDDLGFVDRWFALLARRPGRGSQEPDDEDRAV